MKKFFCFIFLSITTLLLVNCGGGNKETVSAESSQVVNDPTSASDSLDEIKEFKFFKAIGDIPSPAHEIVEITKSGIKYNSLLPNAAQNESKYTDNNKVCLNYGIYSCDLAYCASFKENADLMNYFLVNRKMAEKAGALSIFEEITKQYGFETNTKNSDSLEAILDKVYYATEKFCQDQHKLDIAVKILLGSWIESQYLTLSALITPSKSEKNSILKTKIWENYLHLRNIMDLLKEYENHPELNSLNTELAAYSELYKDTHGSEDFSKERISKMYSSLTAIRNKIIE